MSVGRALLLAAPLLAALASCGREKRDFADLPGAQREPVVALSTLAPGAAGPVVENTNIGDTIEGNAFQLSEGKRLYAWFNCTGCHANGGGGSGPPLMDKHWI